MRRDVLVSRRKFYWKKRLETRYGPAKIEARTYRKQARIYWVIYSLLATDSAVYDIHRTRIIRSHVDLSNVIEQAKYWTCNRIYENAIATYCHRCGSRFTNIVTCQVHSLRVKLRFNLHVSRCFFIMISTDSVEKMGLREG